MKLTSILSLIFILFFPKIGIPQGVKSQYKQFELLGKINFSDTFSDISVGIKSIKSESYHGVKGLDLKKSFIATPNNSVATKKNGNLPFISKNFPGNLTNGGTPMDNNVAVSHEGKVVSVVNTNVRIFDSTGQFLFSRSLSNFANKLGILDRPFDPHVLYDADEKRFIMMFLNGADHTNTNLILAFSETEDPTKTWNFYKLEGNITPNQWWSDYPFFAISNQELFISVLLWDDDESGWDSDAKDENIWQINKFDGYEAKPLRSKVYNNLEINGRQVWNSRPVGEALKNCSYPFYFVANRPKDIENDSIFLLQISGPITSGADSLSYLIMQSPVKYGLQPNALQNGNKKLRTNYCDIQHAFIENNIIHFVSNSISSSSGLSAIYYGRIDFNNSSFDAQIIESNSNYLNYPSIAYSGSGAADHSVIISCQHSNSNSFPGVSAFYVNTNFEPSDELILIEGKGAVNILVNDSLERWGDYIGSCIWPGQKGKVWVAAAYGNANGNYGNQIFCLQNTDLALKQNFVKEEKSISIYPNPISEKFSVKINAKEIGNYKIRVFTLEGKLIQEYVYFNSLAGMKEIEIINEFNSRSLILQVESPIGEIWNKKLLNQ